jgi:hypothetical protein
VDGYSHVVPSCLEKSKTAKEFDASPAARAAQVIWYEEHASYDGLAVGWGIGNKKPTAKACAQACKSHKPGPPNYGLFANLPCNAWVWCPLEHAICFEPDAHTHHAGDCWLKFTEVPEAIQVNQRGSNDAPETARGGVAYRTRWGLYTLHAVAPYLELKSAAFQPSLRLSSEKNALKVCFHI